MAVCQLGSSCRFGEALFDVLITSDCELREAMVIEEGSVAVVRAHQHTPQEGMPPGDRTVLLRPKDNLPWDP